MGRQKEVRGHILAAATQAAVTDVCDRDSPVERLMHGFPPVPAGAASPPPAEAFPGPPSSDIDVQVTLGRDHGGDAGRVRIVATVINQAHPKTPANTFMVRVGPCQYDKYNELAAILDTHLPKLDALLRDRV